MKDLDGWIDEVLALDSAKCFKRKQVTIGRSVTGDWNMSADLATFQKRKEKSNFSEHPFGNPATNRDWKLYYMFEVIHGYVLSVILTKSRRNTMSKFLHFEFWVWHSFWFFAIYRSLLMAKARLCNCLVYWFHQPISKV